MTEIIVWRISHMRFLTGMHRLHLFEFCDQPWLPGRIRELFHLMLSCCQRFLGIYGSSHRLLAHFCRNHSAVRSLDLCSGTGTAIENVVRRAEKERLELPEIFLSDLYPDMKVMNSLARKYNTVNYISGPVNSLDFSLPEFSICTLYTGFHHFRPAEASRLLANLLSSGKSLLLFEPFERKLSVLLWYLAALPLLVALHMITALHSRPLSLITWFFCVLLPVIPLMVYWDGLVSIFRVYKAEEIREMLRKLNLPCQFEFGLERSLSPIQSYACVIQPQKSPACLNFEVFADHSDR